jgi:hypothetical protein
MSDQTVKPMRTSLLEQGRVEPVATAVMTRTADALHRLERLAEAIEKATAEGERQLAVIRGRL